MQGFFITATNTDRGKTLVTAGLRLWLQKQSLSCLAMKPVQTGMQGQKLSPDLYQIYAAGYDAAKTEEQIYDELGTSLLPLLQPFCYEDACSPHLAAERNGLPYADIATIQSCAHRLQTDVLLVEGAGGFYVPLNRQETIADLAFELGFPVILVAQSGLGAINDACLSLRAIQNRGLRVAGFILNDWPEGLNESYIREDNPKIIAELSGAKYLGTLPYLRQGLRAELLLRAFKKLKLRQLLDYLPN